MYGIDQLLIELGSVCEQLELRLLLYLDSIVLQPLSLDERDGP